MWTIVITILSPVVIWILGALTLRLFWAWFVYPGYHVAVPSLPVALGFMLIPSLFTARSYAAYIIDRQNGDSEGSDEPTERALRTDMLAILLVILTLAFGWIVHFFA